MSDWRQIQARIRKARTSSDPPGQLSALFERTRDAMVAFELAQIHEKAGSMPEAVRWYTTAAERFRRPQWKQKAEEGLVRLGAPVPAAPAAAAAAAVSEVTAEPAAPLAPIIAEFSDEQPVESASVLTEGQQESVFEQPRAPAAAPSAAAGQERRRRRRGRRGGRGRRKDAPGATSSAATTPLPAAGFGLGMAAEPRAFSAGRSAASAELAESRLGEPEAVRGHEPAAVSGFAARGRSGDPALSSRMAQLESQLRRLLACSLHSLDQPEEAPAGPGVFLITDTDQTTYYYAEACQTLRVGIGNMLRSGRGSREGSNLKERLAEHLGVTEARVGKYLKEHCGVRWLQLDEGAALLAHFAVAVLRPVVNE